MNIQEHWQQIRRVVDEGRASSIYCSIASIDSNGIPNVTPIGTVFLRDDLSGFYFEKYASALARNLDANPRLCLMAVNAGRLYWFTSLLRGRFASPPGVRLYGRAGPLRPASEQELAQLDARVRSTRWMKGNRLLWSDFTHVREMHFSDFKPVTYPGLTEALWT